MSFLSLAFLFALPLATAPILLHLFDRQRKIVIEWGAMQFLAEAIRRRTRARRLQQWLLLLLRVMAITCLVLALARPMVRTHWIQGTNRSETIIIVDNSLSMQRLNNGQSLYDAAIERAVQILDTTPTGDSVRILSASPYPVWMTPIPQKLNSDLRTVLAAQLRELKPTLGQSDLLGTLQAAVQSEPVRGTRHRRIVILTDGQATDWNSTSEDRWRHLHEAARSCSVATAIELVSPGEQGTAGMRNIAVNQIHSNRSVVGLDQAATLTAQVQNYGKFDSAPCVLRWLKAEEELQRSDVPGLAPGAVHEIICKQAFSKPGVYSIAAVLNADDVLLPDNQATAIVEVVDRIPVLVLESSGSGPEIMQDAFFVQAALGWIDGEPLDSQGAHVPTVVSMEQFQRLEFDQYRAIVVPNLTTLDESVIARLQQFVADGGGLWIALGPRTDPERFNQLLFADANGLSPLAVDRIVEEAVSGEHKTTIDPTANAHPATSSLADVSRLDTGRIAVQRRFRFVPPPEGETTSVLLSLSNGDPVAVEKSIGRGRVIIQSIPLRLQWSDLARSQAFVVMVQEWMNYLTEPRATRFNLTPGEPISLQVASGGAAEATLRMPLGEDVELTANPLSDGVEFRTGRTSQPGDYFLEIGLAGDRIPFHVRREAKESDLAPLPSAQHTLLAEISAQTQGRQAADGSTPVQSDPVWPLLLILLVVLIAAELLLSGSMSRHRFGADAIAETVLSSSITTWETGGLAKPEPAHLSRTPSRELVSAETRPN
jgi:hypothetical protein